MLRQMFVISDSMHRGGSVVERGRVAMPSAAWLLWLGVDDAADEIARCRPDAVIVALGRFGPIPHAVDDLVREGFPPVIVVSAHAGRPFRGARSGARGPVVLPSDFGSWQLARACQDAWRRAGDERVEVASLRSVLRALASSRHSVADQGRDVA